MDAQQKIYSVILAIEDAVQIKSKKQPLLLYHRASHVKAIPQHELAQILEKLSKDEKVIKLLRIPLWVSEMLPIILGQPEVEESFEIKLLPTFQAYAEAFHQKYQGDNGNFVSKPFGKSSKANKETLSTREKNTLLKLVLGMAIKGYTYDPKQSRNSAVTDIASDLEALGISVDADTIRKWLKEAAESHLTSQALEAS